jgi:hypothetical protein
MFAANTYLIRLATAEDAASLVRLARRESRSPLAGRVLIGQIDGAPAAAMSLADGRVVADPLRATGHLVACLRVRARALAAYEATPLLRMRMLAGLTSSNRPGIPAGCDDAPEEREIRMRTAA